MKFIDLFAGIGGFRRGMELAGHECVGFCEYDKHAAMSYTMMHLATEEQRRYIESIPAPLKKNGEPNLRMRQQEILKEEYRNGEWYAEDIRTINIADMPRADCWCFGFPCQDISISGNCLGFKGHRSSLFFAVTKLIRDLPEEDKPRYLFIENVKNLLSVNKGFDFARLLIELDEIGYDAEWSLLNSKDFGVPQNRERVFIVGHLRGRSTGKVFPLTETDGIHHAAEPDGQVHEVAQCLTATRDNPNQGRIYDPEGITPCMNKMEGGGREPMIPIFMTRREVKETDIANTLTAGTPDKKRGNYSPVTGVAIPVLAPDRAEKRQNGRRFKDNGEPMFTLTGQDRHGVAIEVEPVGVLRNVRTEYGKRIRKQYESGKLKVSRHSFLAYKIRENGVSNTVTTVEKDNYLALKVKEATKQGYSIAYEGDAINLDRPGSSTRRGRVGNQVANTLDTSCNQGIFVQVSDELTVHAIWYEKYQCYIAIRKLTPKECFRLQGWQDEYFERAAVVNADSKLYCQTGNGVTVNVIYEIAKRLKYEN